MPASGADDPLETGHGRVGVDGVVDEIGEGLAGELVDDVQDLDGPAGAGDVELVVERPDMVEPLGSEPFDGDAQTAKGVRVLSTPGHSPGHQSVVFDTADGGVVLAGQAIYSKAEYEHLQATNTVSVDDPPPDPEHYLASAARLL